MSSTHGESLSSLERSKRTMLRSLNSLRSQIDKALKENPSEDCAHKIGALLDSFKISLDQLESLLNDILDVTETKDLTEKQIEDLEKKTMEDFQSHLVYHSLSKGKLNAMFARLNRVSEPATSRRSLNSTFIGDGAPQNPLVKLPDIPVPKFDGKISNFTEWHSLFKAMIDSNENLKPVQKLYYLKQAMTGDVQNLLKDYELQEDLYDQAWAFVKERYFNKRVIIANHFRDLLDLPQISFATLRESLDKVNAIIRGLRVCSLHVDKMSPLIAYIVVRKLPERLRTDWENSHSDYSTYPSFEPLSSFLQNRCFSYESVHSDSSPKGAVSKPDSSTEKKKTKSSLATVAKIKVSSSSSTSSSTRCLLCEKSHYLSNCAEFLAKSVADRFAFAREKQLCTNCLRQFHISADCNSSKCKKCNKPHHTLLHREVNRSGSPEKPAPKAEPPKSDETPNKSSLTIVTRKTQIVLLPSAVVLVRVKSRLIKARVIIDPCSQANLISEAFAKNFNRSATRPTSSAIVGVTPGSEDSMVSVEINLKSRFDDFQLKLEADVIGRIPYQVTSDIIKCVESLEASLPLGDCLLPSSAVDILIGGEHANKILLGKKKFFGDFCLEESRFGWVAEGPLDRYAAVNNRCCHLTVQVSDTLARFWEVEEVKPPKPILDEHEQCEAHFNSSYNRLPNGQFAIRLPRKKSSDSLANTYAQARAALLRFEVSLNQEVRSMYIDFMKEYRDLGHMELASDLNIRRYHIPHLPVLRPDSSTTKFRAVFNASAKNKSGNSLNEILMTGPTLQPDLFDILIKFRTYKIAFSADISKMYRQVSVHPDDRPLQSILWRDNPNDPIKEYQLTTLTYGTAPASYIATKCLQVLAKEIEVSNPEESLAISSEFYMDDLLTGADSVETATRKREAIHKQLESAKFPLRKYVSNSKEFLNQLDQSLVETLKSIAFASTGAAKILGLQWDPVNDCFFVNVKIVDISKLNLTKRSVSSLAAQAFDPLGFAAPVIIRAKILLQDLWREGKDWDDPVSQKIDEDFRNYYRELECLPSFKVPRWYSSTKTPKFDLIGFCDASNRAYGAVLYMRVHTESGIVTNLLCAKSKVAPLKEVTIPRLELLGAVLLTKLLQRVSKILKYDISLATLFCDSTIVLAWLKGTSSKFQTFVRNRVEFVQSVTPSTQWFYVKTTENPADLLTRGIPVKSIINNELWLKGPEWLVNKSFQPISISIPTDLPETRKTCMIAANTVWFDESLIKRHSSLDKLIRIVSIMCDFVFHAKSTLLNKYESLDARTRSMIVICHISQVVHFRAEILALEKGLALPSKSTLLALQPFLDSFGILRVGGRLRNSDLSYETRHPIILSRKSVLTELIVRHIHEKYFHASRSFTLAFLQSRFWVHGGAPRIVKKVIGVCTWCARMKGESLSQLMGELPKERSRISHPFAYSGVDFAGPFSIKCTNHRSAKHLKYYIAFFICLTTRAVHLEPVSDLSTNAFIESLQRFSARRGIPNTIWSDNATNFVGTRNVLDRHCQSVGIKWKFIPARSPHHGGIWEAAVKAGKKHLVAAIGEKVLTAEQLTTIVSQVESILNSRPMYQKRSTKDPEVIDVLTPGHFLVGSHLLHSAPPETQSISLIERFELQHQIVSAFWKHWQKGYLNQLQARSKWKSPQPNIAIGDIVLLREDTPPTQWKIGRVMQVTPDSQGRTRIVSVSSNGSEYQRSVQKLVKLPVEEPVGDS